MAFSSFPWVAPNWGVGVLETVGLAVAPGVTFGSHWSSEYLKTSVNFCPSVDRFLEWLSSQRPGVFINFWYTCHAARLFTRKVVCVLLYPQPQTAWGSFFSYPGRLRVRSWFNSLSRGKNWTLSALLPVCVTSYWQASSKVKKELMWRSQTALARVENRRPVSSQRRGEVGSFALSASSPLSGGNFFIFPIQPLVWNSFLSWKLVTASDSWLRKRVSIHIKRGNVQRANMASF